MRIPRCGLVRVSDLCMGAGLTVVSLWCVAEQKRGSTREVGKERMELHLAEREVLCCGSGRCYLCTLSADVLYFFYKCGSSEHFGHISSHLLYLVAFTGLSTTAEA